MDNNKHTEKTCSCGHSIENPMVTVKTRYNKYGWIMLSLFFSVQPIEIIYQCQKCGEIIDKSTDPVLLNKYRYSSDITK